MTVKELIDVSPCCDVVEIVIRKEGRGQWIQGYRIGKNVQLFPSEITKEVLEKNKLEKVGSVAPLDPDQEVDMFIYGNRLPMKVICKDVKKMPEAIGNLKICEVIPRHVPQFHHDALIHNEHEYDIECYPEGYQQSIENYFREE